MPTSAVSPQEAIVGRLAARFLDMPAPTLRRCVDDLWMCCEHLGVHPDADLVERLASARLTGMLKATPPSTPKPLSPTPQVLQH